MPPAHGVNDRSAHPLESDICPPLGKCPPPLRRDLFGEVAAWTTHATGGKWAFLGALAVVAIWAVSGPFFRFSELWQLVINTGTTIVTFLMVFLIQNAQNRESKAVHLKLDELILALRGAKNELIDIESLTEGQLEQLAGRYRRFAERYHRNLESTLEGVEQGVGRIGETVAEVGESVRRVEREVSESRGKVGASS